MPGQDREIVIELPPPPASRSRDNVLDWREALLVRASSAAERVTESLSKGSDSPATVFVNHEKIEVQVDFWLVDPEPSEDESCWPDIDNLIKDVLDALQGALFLPGKQRDQRRLFRSDKQVYRLIAEKHHRSPTSECGGRLVIRPYRRTDS